LIQVPGVVKLFLRHHTIFWGHSFTLETAGWSPHTALRLRSAPWMFGRCGFRGDAGRSRSSRAALLLFFCRSATLLLLFCRSATLLLLFCRSATLLLLFCRFAALRAGPAAARNL